MLSVMILYILPLKNGVLMKRTVKLEKSSLHLLERYINQFETDERYFVADEAITKLFEHFPGNFDLHHYC